METEQRLVKLSSSQGDVFEVEFGTACYADVVKQMIDFTSESSDAETIPLNLKTTVLEKVLQYCDYHRDNEPKEIPKPLPTTNLGEIVGDWDAAFINVDDENMLYELILAANYLDIKPLLDLACAKAACAIKHMTPDAIREHFNLQPEQMTPEEEQEMLEELKWCTDGGAA
mmetsp:Transcript_16775/g.40266  ORF Transcript_16775/g.40266 Transcript_16775/m.40266 type:complete len:171 (-) Transcript_16775:631-1143(-)